MLTAGDLVVAPFLFTDFSMYKVRPALVISSEEFNHLHSDVVLLAISTKEPRGPFDCPIARWREAGLKYPSKVAVGKFMTVHQSLVGPIGRLSAEDFRAVIGLLARLLGIPYKGNAI